jgi:hypothetical protein
MTKEQEERIGSDKPNHLARSIANQPNHLKSEKVKELLRFCTKCRAEDTVCRDESFFEGRIVMHPKKNQKEIIYQSIEECPKHNGKELIPPENE